MILDPTFYHDREQSGVKHFLLEEYLEKLAYHILMGGSRDFVYVDGFSGPWNAKDKDFRDTSFGTAITTLSAIKKDVEDKCGQRKSVKCVFVERDPKAFEEMSSAVKRIKGELDVLPIKGEFQDVVGDVSRKCGDSFALVFIDPTSWNVHLRAMAPLLKHRRREVMINFMYDHINRQVSNSDAIRKTFTQLFGDDDWEEEFQKSISDGFDREFALTSIFRNRLTTYCDFRYVLSTPIRRTKAERTHYHIVFGTNSVAGVDVFRDVEFKTKEFESLVRFEAMAVTTQDKNMQLTFLSPHDDAENELRRFEQKQIDLAERWIVSEFQQRLRTEGRIDFKKVRLFLMTHFVLRKPHCKTLLQDASTKGWLRFEGMKPGQRKPDDNVTVVWCG